MKSFIELVQEIKKAFDKDDNSVLHNINSNIEETSTAQFPHNVGTQLIYNKTLYDVISAISVNDTLEVGVNIIESPSITNQLGNKVPTYSNTPSAWDTAPTENSTKPVTSGGVYQALSSVTVADMTGATASTDGAHGLVPAPLIADRDKVLKGDGTWSGEIGDEISDIVNILSSKNLLQNNASSQIVNGVTFTVNSDGSITANGTASALAVLNLEGFTGYKASQYKANNILSGCTGGSTATYYMYMDCSNDGSSYASSVILDDGEITIPEYNYFSALYIAIKAGTTLNNAKFYPMIRPANIKDDTYTPHTSRLTVVNIPYSQFTWNTADSSFIANVSHLPSTPIGFFTTSTNGNAIMGVRRYSNSEIRVFGWIPLSGRSITSDYVFMCYAVLQV